MNEPGEPGDGLEQVQVEIAPTEAEPEEKVSVEEFTINGDALVSKVKELIHEGNIRRIIIKNDEGRILIEIPLTVGVVGGVISAALFPVVAAVGVIGAMVAHLTLVIEKKA
jgi:CBS domain-containing protein